jgi:hypothetical protein
MAWSSSETVSEAMIVNGFTKSSQEKARMEPGFSRGRIHGFLRFVRGELRRIDTYLVLFDRNRKRTDVTHE